MRVVKKQSHGGGSYIGGRAPADDTSAKVLTLGRAMPKFDLVHGARAYRFDTEAREWFPVVTILPRSPGLQGVDNNGRNVARMTAFNQPAYIGVKRLVSYESLPEEFRKKYIRIYKVQVRGEPGLRDHYVWAWQNYAVTSNGSVRQTVDKGLKAEVGRDLIKMGVCEEIDSETAIDIYEETKRRLEKRVTKAANIKPRVLTHLEREIERFRAEKDGMGQSIADALGEPFDGYIPGGAGAAEDLPDGEGGEGKSDAQSAPTGRGRKAKAAKTEPSNGAE